MTMATLIVSIFFLLLAVGCIFGAFKEMKRHEQEVEKLLKELEKTINSINSPAHRDAPGGRSRLSGDEAKE